jgi:hypothetical protein
MISYGRYNTLCEPDKSGLNQCFFMYLRQPTFIRIALHWELTNTDCQKKSVCSSAKERIKLENEN